METVYPSRICQLDMGCQATGKMIKKIITLYTKKLQCITNCQCTIIYKYIYVYIYINIATSRP